MALERQDGYTRSPIFREPGAWVEAGGPASGGRPSAAPGVAEPPGRVPGLGPEEAAGPPGVRAGRVELTDVVQVHAVAIVAAAEGATTGALPAAFHPGAGPATGRPEARVLGEVMAPVILPEVGAPPASTPVPDARRATVLTVAAVVAATTRAGVPSSTFLPVVADVGAAEETGAGARGQAHATAPSVVVAMGRRQVASDQVGVPGQVAGRRPSLVGALEAFAKALMGKAGAYSQIGQRDVECGAGSASGTCRPTTTKGRGTRGSRRVHVRS